MHRLLFATAALAVLLTGCRPAQNHEPPATTRWPVMSTVAELSLPAAAAANLSRLQPVVADCFASVDQSMSLFQPTSEIARINQMAGAGPPTTIGAETADVLRYALRVAQESDSAFDPTISPLMKLWGFRRDVTVVERPTDDALRTTMEQIGWRHIQLTPGDAATSATARLARPGMALDLGGIAKGYAVDQACEALLKQGCPDFLVNLAGNMRARGTPGRNRNGWRVGIRDPLHDGAWLGTIILRDGEGIATSGNYERYVIIDGQRYTHIIDPRTGHPVTGLISVTVLATSALEADALSTALFVLGVEQRRALLDAHPNCGAVYLLDTHPPRIEITPALHLRFTPAPAWADAVQSLD